MRSTFDPRVVPAAVVVLLRELQRHVPCHLAGGAALSGLHLAHRLSADIDLFCHEAKDVRDLVRDLEAPPPLVEGVLVESFADLRASKLTCLLSRSEPRDLVDLLFLDRAGHAPERDLAPALRKDAGIDPGALAWLLRDFPLSPLPRLEPLTEGHLGAFRDQLAERFRRIAVP